MGRVKKQWVEKKVRFQPSQAKMIEEAAHCARLPLAVYMRSMLTTGIAPEPAPPAVDEMSFGSVALATTINGLMSNLTQIEQHAIRLGEPTSRLTGSQGALQSLKKKALDIGLTNRGGELRERDITRALKKLQPIAHDLNGQIAKPLNHGEEVPMSTWRQILENLEDALLAIATQEQTA
jgi:hypothetical protein